MDPRAVLGVEAGATLAQVRSRYRVLAKLYHPDRMHGMADDVRVEAERRMKELNAAYSELESQLSHRAEPTTSKPDSASPPPMGRTVVNPRNARLSTLDSPERPDDTDNLWDQLGIEPVMIRLAGQTGLTLATPTIHAENTGTRFLVDRHGLHLSSSVEGLIDVACAHGPWRREARSLKPRHVVPLPEYRFDVTEMIDSIERGVNGWDTALLIGVHNLAYELAIFLDIDEAAAALMPGSGLYRLYQLVWRHSTGGSLSRWRAREGLERFDLVSVFDAWNDIESILSRQIEWHP